MMTAPFAVLFHLDTIGIILLIFLGRVITAFALRALQGDQRTHAYSLNDHIRPA
jgi:hypothetical protein